MKVANARERKLAEHLKNVLIAFSYPNPDARMCELVSEASIFLQKLDPKWRQVCKGIFSEGR